MSRRHPPPVEGASGAGLAAQVLERAGVTVVPGGRGDRYLCSYLLWPEAQLTVQIPAAHLDAVLRWAAEDVADVWPGRDTVDGALSLLAIHLESTLDTADTVPVSVMLSREGRWLLVPSPT